ncbi:hypothetical protein TRFO_03499 [Tritrichomonas foetus]|uniref:Guanylate cyclase domain-containing protein n=1 Tax=Tritrichomonas foetus TaxID=1144522 RepID=A0A1J4KU97_9EUKA|nr:hypothetical protein TRFO_03499 [Tritrichomonas foetus]|eukprot:OHT13069.1 hypothetical protein TRFO_03499 [Tritrichomonas foetus]
MKDLSNAIGNDDFSDEDVVLEGIQYGSIIEIPLTKIVFQNLLQYFAKVHSMVKTHSFIGFIFAAIYLIQIYFPSFLIDAISSYKERSVLEAILKVLAYLWRGPEESYDRAFFSFFVALVYFVFIVFLVYRSWKYQKTKKLAFAEAYFILLIFKFVLTLAGPLLLAGIPSAVKDISTFLKFDEKSGLPFTIFELVFITVIFIIFVIIQSTVVSPRVLLENTKTHEWLPNLAPVMTTYNALFSMCSNIPFVFETVGVKISFAFMMAISSIIGSILFFYNSGLIHRVSVFSISAVMLSSSINCFMTGIDFTVNSEIHIEVKFIVGVISLFAIIIILKLINDRLIVKMMAFLDSCIDFPETAKSEMDMYFKSSYMFLCKIRLVIEFWHPYFFSWELFDFAKNKWPDNIYIYILFARLMSIFPSKNGQMMWVASIISKLPKTYNRTTYLLQLRHLSRARQTTMSPLIRRQIDVLENKSEGIIKIIRGFWENVLQKNVSMFWDDVSTIHHKIVELDSLFSQLIDDYPNNEQIILAYLNFTDRLSKNLETRKKLKKKLTILKREGKTETDAALEIGMTVFPSLNVYTTQATTSYQSGNKINKGFSKRVLAVIHDEPEIMSTGRLPDGNPNDPNGGAIIGGIIQKSRNGEDDEDEDDNEDEENAISLEVAIQELTNRSKLGSIIFGVIFLVITTGLSIGLYVLFHNYYISQFIQKEKNAVDFLHLGNIIQYDLIRIFTLLNGYALTMAGDEYIITNMTEYMMIVAPELYSHGAIPIMNITAEGLIYYNTELKIKFGSIVETLSLLDLNDKSVQKITQIMIENIVFNGLSFVAIVTQMFIDINAVLEKYKEPKAFFHSPEFERLSVYFNESMVILNLVNSEAQLYATTYEPNSNQLLNEYLILCLIATLLLVTLPYILLLFLIQLQSEAVAESFQYFPNTDVRSIINKFGESTQKLDSKSQFGRFTQIRKDHKVEEIALVVSFFSTFLVATICLLGTYYMSENFILDAAVVGNRIGNIYKHFEMFDIVINYFILLYSYDRDMQLAPSIQTRPELFINIDMILSMSVGFLKTALYDEFKTVNSYYQNEDETLFNYFTDVFPISNETVDKPKTILETIATMSFPDSLDVLTLNMKTRVVNFPKKLIEKNDEFFLCCLYYLYSFFPTFRGSQFFTLVIQDTYDVLSNYRHVASIFLNCMIIFQILSLIFMIIYLSYQSNKIRKALRFYQYFSPQSLINNKNAIVLLETGKKHIEKNRTTSSLFPNSEEILEKIKQATILTDRDLNIIEVNECFLDLSLYPASQVCGIRLTDVFLATEGDTSVTEFITNINDVLNGRHPTMFQADLSTIINKQLYFISVNVFAMTSSLLATEGNYREIEKIAFVIEDFTEEHNRLIALMMEAQSIKNKLLQVIPENIVEELDHNDSISFVSQSVTIGHVSIENHPNNFDFYSQIFQEIDNEIHDNFPNLIRTKMYSNKLIFAGGLFTDSYGYSNVHAEACVKLALKLISQYKFLKIGIHTGGPIIAGVMSPARPNFIMIGPVMELSAQMNETSEIGHVHITRSVYELIFASGFRIIELGDTKLRDRTLATTYYVLEN